MNTFRQIGTILLLCLLFAPVLVLADGQKEKAIELTYWNEFPDGARMRANEAMIDAFHKENPKYRIINRPISNEDFFMALRTGFASNDSPDIFQHESMESLWQLVRNGHVADISDWYASHKDRFVSGIEKQGQYDGKIYSIPLFSYVWGMFYNKDMLKKYNIGSIQEWPDFLAACEKFKQAGIAPISLGNKHGWPGSQWLVEFFVRNVGAKHILEIATGNPKYRWDDPVVVNAAAYYEQLYKNGYFTQGAASDDFGGMVALFASGKAPFMMTATSALSTLVDTPPDFSVGITAFPQFPGQKGDANGICTITFGMSLSASCKDMEGGRKFLDTISRVDVAQKFVSIGQLPSSVIGAITEKTAKPLLLEANNNLIPKNAIDLPLLDLILPAEMGEGGIFYTGSVGILTGELTAEEWMKAAEKEMRKYKPILLKNMY